MIYTAFTKRQLRKLFMQIIYSSIKISNISHEDKNFYKINDPRRYQTFIQDNALEYIMMILTGKTFDKNSNINKKYYKQIFGK